MRERILVTGATGRLGRELVRRLAGCEEVIRIGTRWPERARPLSGPAVEVVELDYEATETYDAALQWVDRLFLSPPPFDPDAYETLVALLDWSIDTGVRRVVLLSAMGTEYEPDLPLTRLEKHIAELDIDFTVLRPNLFMQNFSEGFIADAIRETGEFELCAGTGAVSFVDVRDVAAIAADALTGPASRTALTLTGPKALNFEEAADTLASASGRAIRYLPVSAEQMRATLRAKRWPARQADVAVRMFGSVAEGRRQPVTSDVEEALGTGPISFETFSREVAEALR